MQKENQTIERAKLLRDSRDSKITEKCEYKNTCELQKILSENKDLKAKNKELRAKIEELEMARSWRNSPEMMGK